MSRIKIAAPKAFASFAASRSHRASAVTSIATGCSAIVSLAGVFILQLNGGLLRPAVKLDLLPDNTWNGAWLAGAVSASAQQQQAAQQWLHLVLVFGCIAAIAAFANALLALFAHANDRRYEMAVSGLVGASPQQLRSQHLRSSVVNASIGVATGAPIGVALALAIRSYWPGQINTHLSAIEWTLVASVCAFVITQFAARVSSARYAKRGWLGDALAPEARTTPGYGAEDLRTLLNTAQLGCAVALTIAGALVWSYAGDATNAQTKHSNVYVARASGDSARVLALLHTTDVQAESIATPGALLGIGKVDKVVSDCGRCVRANMFTPLLPVETQQHVVGNGFFTTAGVRIIYGEDFSAATQERSVIINRAFAQNGFDTPNPIGRRILVGGLGGTWYKVVAVVEDIASVGMQSLAPEAGSPVTPPGHAPAIYFSAAEHPPIEYDVVVRSPRNPAVAGFAFQPFESIVHKATASQAWFARVALILGMLLCAAALGGSFVTIMLSVEARRSEIAVRRAMGARRRHIWQMMFVSVGGLLLRALVFGIITSAALSRAIAIMVPGLPAFSFTATLFVAAAFVLAVTVAALIPIRTALEIPPAYVHQ